VSQSGPARHGGHLKRQGAQRNQVSTVASCGCNDARSQQRDLVAELRIGFFAVAVTCRRVGC
jgi:hypothetical protein